MKILLFLAKGFEPMEASVFIDIPGWARTDFDNDVETVTCGFTKQVESSFGLKVICDKTIDEIDQEEYAAIAIPGGFEVFGFYEEAFDEKLGEMIRSFDQAGKPIASICVGALAVANSGVLNGSRATTYRFQGGERQDQLAEYDGVTICRNDDVVIDGNKVTSCGPSTAPAVGYALLEMLIGKERSEEVKSAMGF